MVGARELDLMHSAFGHVEAEHDSRLVDVVHVPYPHVLVSRRQSHESHVFYLYDVKEVVADLKSASYLAVQHTALLLQPNALVFACIRALEFVQIVLALEKTWFVVWLGV